MPSPVDFHFQSSLRGTANNKSPDSSVKLHRGCSGALHGHGVDKVKSKVVPAPCQRDRSCQQYSSTNTGYDPYHHAMQQQLQLQQYADYHHRLGKHHLNDTLESEDSDAESTARRKKSMLGLGQVLPAAESKGLPPRSPPKFLTYSTRSLSSSTCSSSSSSRYSGSPSPGIQDQYNSPLTWPSSAASAGFYLEEVSEEGDIDLDSSEWAERTSPSCSTLESSTNGGGDSLASLMTDQGRRQQQRPQPPSTAPPRHHSTPNRPYTERNRPSSSDSKAINNKPAVKRTIISPSSNSSNSNSKSSSSNNKNKSVGATAKSPSSAVSKKPLNSSNSIKRSDSSKSMTSTTSSSRTYTRQNSPPSVSSTPRSSISSIKTDRSSSVKSNNNTTTIANSKNNKNSPPLASNGSRNVKRMSPVNGTTKGQKTAATTPTPKRVARGTPVTPTAPEVVRHFWLPLFSSILLILSGGFFIFLSQTIDAESIRLVMMAAHRSTSDDFQVEAFGGRSRLFSYFPIKWGKSSLFSIRKIL